LVSGKTAIVRRYTEGKFSSNYKITIGADFSLKTIQWDQHTRLNLQLWDVAGHERFGYMTRVYYKYAIGCVIVFDITRLSSFQSVKRWLTDLREKVVYDNGQEIPVVLLANKCDTGDSVVSQEGLKKYCKEEKITAWFMTSAKNNINIDEAMNCLITNALGLILPKESDGFCLTKETPPPELVEENKCCQ